MVETILLFALSRKIGRMAAEKGRSPSALIVLLLCFYAGGALLGGAAGFARLFFTVANLSDIVAVGPLLQIYACTVVGGSLAAWLAFVVADCLKVAPAKGPSQVQVGDKVLEVPDEQFWLRHSPHHEFALSSVTCQGLYALFIGLAVLMWLVMQATVTAHYSPPRVEAVHYVPSPLQFGGGGGSPGGHGAGAGVGGDNEPPPEFIPSEKRNDVKPERGPADLPVGDVPQNSFEGPKFKANPEIAAQIERGNEAAQNLADLDQNIRKQLATALQKKGEGKGGSGSGGGTGAGTGSGTGSGAGPGKGTLSVREKRVLRWTLVFTRSSGEDYARQLQFFEAILAVQDIEEADKLRLFEDLSQRPVKGAVKDVTDLNRIFWVDSEPESVRALVTALGIKPPPSKVVAFFPEKFEQKLLQLEHAWLNKAEDDIEETRFRVVPTSPGKYDVQVTSQKLKR